MNYIGIILAAISGILIGMVWYSPKLFGNAWMKLSGITSQHIKRAKARGMGKAYILGFVGLLATSAVLDYILKLTPGVNEYCIGAVLWLGFITPVHMGSVIWEGKPWRLFLINTGYHLVTVMAMVAILHAL